MYIFIYAFSKSSNLDIANRQFRFIYLYRMIIINVGWLKQPVEKAIVSLHYNFFLSMPLGMKII